MKPVTKKAQPLANRKKEVTASGPSKKTVKQLLGELYSDKEYFEKLMEDEGKFSTLFWWFLVVIC